MDKKKLYIILGGTAGLGALLYIIKSRSSAGTASPLTGGSAVSGGAPQFFVPTLSSTAPQSTPTTPASNIPAPRIPKHAPINSSSLTVPNTSTAAVVAANPYTVGTRVTSNEDITQSVYDPLYNSWVDMTSKGGIYTSPGTGVSGSAYNPQWKGNGRLILSSDGSSVMEYSPAGSLVGTYQIGK